MREPVLVLSARTRSTTPVSGMSCCAGPRSTPSRSRNVRGAPPASTSSPTRYAAGRSRTTTMRVASRPGQDSMRTTCGGLTATVGPASSAEARACATAPSPARPSSMASSTRCGGRNATSEREPVLDLAGARARRGGVGSRGRRDRGEATLRAVELRVRDRGVAGHVPGEPRHGERGLARPGHVDIAGCGAVEVQGLARVLLLAFDAPDAGEDSGGGGVQLHGAGAGPLARRARLDRLRERERLGPDGQRGLPGGDRARRRHVAPRPRSPTHRRHARRLPGSTRSRPPAAKAPPARTRSPAGRKRRYPDPAGGEPLCPSPR